MTKENNELNLRAKGRLWIVAAPSGGGKTSLVEAAIDKMDKIIRSVSFTTRTKRVGEIDGKDYVFVDKAAFEQLIRDKAMLEYENVFGNYYGTSLAFIENHLHKGIDVVLTIDWQGSRRVREKMPASKGIFILPNKLSVLEERLKNRGQDDAKIIAARMAQAKEQASHYDEFDYLIINDNFDRALLQMLAIFSADRLLRERQAVNHARLIQNLLK
ncbi:MAG: guanylate kinase [Gammaproteobacteria bacterium]|nr:MAG: guanylate kinase [Gammaproteobacteria bacterium]